MVPNGINPPKIDSFVVISQIFRSKFQQIQMIFVSGHSIFFMKNLSNYWRHKYEQSISQNFNRNFGGVLSFGSTVMRKVRKGHCRKLKLDFYFPSPVQGVFLICYF